MPNLSNANAKIILPDIFLPLDPHPVGQLIQHCKGASDSKSIGEPLT